MKKERLAILIVVIAVFLVFAEQSAFFLKITGKAVQTGDANCTDSDGKLEFYKKGVTVGKATLDSPVESYFDYCFNNTDSNILSCKGYGCSVYEYFCGYRGLVNYAKGLCPYGCKDGRCLTSQEKIETTEQNKITEVEEEESPQQPETQIREEKPAIFTKIVDFLKKIFKK